MLKKLTDKFTTVTGQVMLANLMAAALGFASFFVLARFLSKADFGLWLLYITGFNLAEMIRTGFVRQALVQRLSHQNHQDSDNHKYAGAAFYLALGITILTAITLLIMQIAIPNEIAKAEMSLFVKWYPLVGFISLFCNLDIWLSHAQSNFKRMALLNIIPPLLFIFTCLLAWYFQLSLLTLLIAHSAIRLALSIYALLSNKLILKGLQLASKKHILSIFEFGKYSVATLLGSNLLKSADTLIIGYFLGPASVALYNVPLKILELAEIPLRSIAQTSFPVLAGLHNQNDKAEFNRKLGNYIQKMIIVYAPLAIIGILLSKYLILLVGGNKFIDADNILKIFMVYVAFLPIDRMLGVAFDSIGKPKLNARKVWLMAAINIIGDVLAIFFFESLEAVAAITILNILIGVLVGAWILRKSTGYSIFSHLIKK